MGNKANQISNANTKQKIINTAIDLCAKKGFDAVSMQEIADAVGIKKASIYYYFSGKDQILTDVLEYPMMRIGSMAPKGVETEALIKSLGAEGFLTMSNDLFLRWIVEEKMQKIWRILCIELYHNDQIKKFFFEFTKMSESFWENNFNLMQKHHLIKPIETKTIVKEYLTFFMEAYLHYFLYNYGNTQTSFEETYKTAFEEHTQFIIEAIKPTLTETKQ